MLGQVRSMALPERFLTQMKSEARRVWPIEACGLMLGHIEKEVAHVSDLILAENVEKSTVSFTIDPQTLLQVYLKAEAEAKELVGIFHSHPADAKPSGVDIKFMRMNPVVWFIVSMPRETYAAYRLEGKELIPVRITLHKASA